MKSFHAMSVRGLKASLAAAILFVLVATGPGLAQRGASGRRAAARARDAELHNRELSLQHLGDQLTKQQPTNRDLKLALAQIKEDFERIQAINNEMQAALTGGALNYGQISEVTTEIHKRARRLRTNLAMADLEQGEKREKNQMATDPEQVKALLLSLDRLIMSFVTNPLFQNTKVIDPQQSARANQELAGIIELSHNIRKYSQKMNKSEPSRTRQPHK